MSKHKHLLKIAFTYENTNGAVKYREVDVKNLTVYILKGIATAENNIERLE